MVNLRRKAMLMMAGLLVLSLVSSSCDTLRKKFIRQKKKGEETQNFVPVLEPEEYPVPQKNPEIMYQQHYNLIKAWYKDLWASIDDRGTAKYSDYIIRQVNNHIKEMKKLVDEPTQNKLAKLASYLDYYKESLEYSWTARNVSRIQSDLRYFDRYMRDHLRNDRIKGHFVKNIK